MQVQDESFLLPTKPALLTGFSPGPARLKLSKLELARARLESAGFSVQVRTEGLLHLRGGQGVRKSGDMGFLIRPFVVMEEPDGTYFASVEGVRGGYAERTTPSLAEAVDFVVCASIL